MSKGLTTVELTLVRDCLLKSNPGRDQADALGSYREDKQTHRGSKS